MEPILEVRRLVKRYRQVTAVDGVSFTCGPGVCFGLLGPNGAGKTTTIEMAEGIIEPTGGEILYRGRPRDAAFRQQVGIMFQHTALLDFLVETGPPPYRYWVSDTSPKGYVIERIFAASLCPLPDSTMAERGEIHGSRIRYIDWLFPGILAMNMMFLSEVWFSLEGAPQWIRTVAKVFPLTHLLNAARAVMNDGAGLSRVAPELAILAAMTLLFLLVAAALFSWTD